MVSAPVNPADECRRLAGIPSAMDFEGRSLKGQMRNANKWGVKLAVLLGAQERAQGTVMLKDMTTGTQEPVARGDLVAALQRRLA